MTWIYVTFSGTFWGFFFSPLTDTSKCVIVVSKTMPGVEPICDSGKNIYLNSYLALAYNCFRPEINICAGFNTSETSFTGSVGTHRILRSPTEATTRWDHLIF